MNIDHQDTKDRLWGPPDLASRWNCTVATVMDRVRTKRVPYLWLGPGEPRLTGRGAKFVRFRPKAIEQWEAGQEGFWDPKDPAAPPRPVAVSGLLRGQRSRRPGA